MKRSLPLLTLLIVCFAGGVPSLARPVPELTLKDLDGHKQRLSTLRGNIVVLSFWATWCTPCQEELPRLSALSERYAGKPVKFIAVSIDEPKNLARIAPLLARRAIHLETWTGADTGTMARVGLGDIVPSTLILDEKGEAITRITGEARDEDVSRGVDWLLGGRVGTAPEPALKRY